MEQWHMAQLRVISGLLYLPARYQLNWPRDHLESKLPNKWDSPEGRVLMIWIRLQGLGITQGPIKIHSPQNVWAGNSNIMAYRDTRHCWDFAKAFKRQLSPLKTQPQNIARHNQASSQRFPNNINSPSSNDAEIYITHQKIILNHKI